MTALYTNEQIRELEQAAIAHDFSASQLMQTAGEAGFHLLQELWPDAQTVSVCCGAGNNGGDGYVLAVYAKKAGLTVNIVNIGDSGHLSQAAKMAFDSAQSLDIPTMSYSENAVVECFAKADVIVDAIFGSGLSRAIESPYTDFIEAINKSEPPVLALDVPSGIDVDTGRVCGIAVRAEATMTFIGYKRGLFTGDAPGFCGTVYCDDLDIPQSLFADATPSAGVLEWHNLQQLLPRREREAHKGHYGHVLIIGGDYGMGGAVRMASEAAMRVGAGLVTVATRPEHVTVVNCSRPEIMCHKVNSGGDLDGMLARATVVVIGPGLGQGDWSKSLIKRIFETDHPKVLDADALNLLSEMPSEDDNWVLTPHPGEAARLLGVPCRSVQDDRFQAAIDLQKRYGGVSVLKGVGTIVQGNAKAAIPQVCPAGNPGMATGGMGDVLSGVIGGLLAQGLSLNNAAQTGVLVHAIAADHAAQQGGERGLLATDLMAHLRELVNPDSEPDDDL